ncbi:hypothetical protein CLOP_g8286 [Closterium sp. NIES-67]|nr:hypothetical protein CLOP_g8286 [Closterium sp. NIES-67]
MVSGLISAASGRPPAPRVNTRSGGRRGSPVREGDRNSSSQHRERSRSPRPGGGNGAVTALDLLSGARQDPVQHVENTAGDADRNTSRNRDFPPGFQGERRNEQNRVDTNPTAENAPSRPPPTERNHDGPAREDHNHDRDTARAGRHHERDLNAPAPQIRQDRQDRDRDRADRRTDFAPAAVNPRGIPQISTPGVAEIAEMIARLDPAAQRNLQRIFTGAAGERVTARSTASTAPHSAEHNSARYTDNNVNAGTNNEAIHHVLGLLAALQRGNGADPAPPPEPARVAATVAPRSRLPAPAPEPVDDEMDEEAPHATLDEGNAARPKSASASLTLAPIPPARPQLRSSLVKSDGIRTQLFSFERIQAIARHAISVLPLDGGEQAADYLQQIVEEAEEKIHFLFTADQRGFEVANMALKIKYGEVVEDKNVKAASQIVAASKKRPTRPTHPTSRPEPPLRPRGQGERLWNTWRRDGDGRCFYCREPGHGMANCPQRGQGANRPAKIV